MTTKRLQIIGRVQGVFFRESTRQHANQLGVTGWVRNRLDGSVEALVQGDAIAVEAMVAWARRGPDAARVDHVEVETLRDEADYRSFEKKPTV
jgi:acylphosphatase